MSRTALLACSLILTLAAQTRTPLANAGATSRETPADYTLGAFRHALPHPRPQTPHLRENAPGQLSLPKALVASSTQGN